MAQYESKELFVKVGNRYRSLGMIKSGRIVLVNKDILEIGSQEELFNLTLTDKDIDLLSEMHILRPLQEDANDRNRVSKHSR